MAAQSQQTIGLMGQVNPCSCLCSMMLCINKFPMRFFYDMFAYLEIGSIFPSVVGDVVDDVFTTSLLFALLWRWVITLSSLLKYECNKTAKDNNERRSKIEFGVCSLLHPSPALLGNPSWHVLNILKTSTHLISFSPGNTNFRRHT